MSEDDGFTSAVRLELASLPPPSEREARAELVGMLIPGSGTRSAPQLRGLADLRPGDLPLLPLCGRDGMRLEAPSSAVARRGLALVQRSLGVRPRLTATSSASRRPHGPAYRVTLPVDVVRGREAGRGPRPTRAVTPAEDGDPETAALLRGAVLVAGSFAHPDRPAHLELSGISDAAAPLLLAAVGHLLPTHHVAHDPSRARLVMKSGAAVADLLAALGATRAFLTLDDRRLRRQLRGEANRLANADAANLARAARSAAGQVDVVERAVARSGWEVFTGELRDVALARLANPSASISDLAQLLDVPRATLHRRLQRVEEAARTIVEGPSTPDG